MFRAVMLSAIAWSFATGSVVASGEAASPPSAPPTIVLAEAGAATLPNPAAVFCASSGGVYAIRAQTDGSETGVCILPNGDEVDAWTYFRDHAAQQQ